MPIVLVSVLDHLDMRPLFRDPFGLQALAEHLASHPAWITAQNHPKQVIQTTGSYDMQFIIGKETHGNARCCFGPGTYCFLTGTKRNVEVLPKVEYSESGQLALERMRQAVDLQQSSLLKRFLPGRLHKKQSSQKERTPRVT